MTTQEKIINMLRSGFENIERFEIFTGSLTKVGKVFSVSYVDEPGHLSEFAFLIGSNTVSMIGEDGLTVSDWIDEVEEGWPKNACSHDFFLRTVPEILDGYKSGLY